MSEHTAENDALAEAVESAAETHGYPWLVGVLEGCVRSGWTAERTAAFLRVTAPGNPGVPLAAEDGNFRNIPPRINGAA